MEATMEATMTKVESLADVVSALHDLGYRAKSVDGGVLTGISVTEEDGASRDFPVMITEENGSLEINCQLCTIGDLQQDHDDDGLAVLAWVFLAVNAEIQPWAVALINPDGVLDETDTVVLTDSLPLGDLSTEELDSAMTTLQRALVQVVPTYIK